MFRTININNESTCYSINEYGEVINDKTNKKLKGSITRSGYHYCRFSIRNKKYRYYTHRLVAEYFLNFDPNDKHLIINHIDGNKENNLKELRKGQTTKKVIAFKDGVYIGEYYSCAEAARQLGCDSSAISKVCRGIYQHTHGFTFEYKE